MPRRILPSPSGKRFFRHLTESRYNICRTLYILDFVDDATLRQSVQKALNLLDGANLDQDGTYGPATAAAVLAYKRKRSIINTSYQKTADNIVGIMTIQSMDRELNGLARRPTPGRSQKCSRLF